MPKGKAGYQFTEVGFLAVRGDTSLAWLLHPHPRMLGFLLPWYQSHPTLLCSAGAGTKLGSVPCVVPLPVPSAWAPGGGRKQGGLRLGTCFWLSHCALSRRELFTCPERATPLLRKAASALAPSCLPIPSQQAPWLMRPPLPTCRDGVTADRSPPALPGQRASPWC